MENSTYFFRVADFLFSVRLPVGIDVTAFLPSFVPFRCEANGGDEILFVFTVEENLQVAGDIVWSEDMDNDFGCTRLMQVGEDYLCQIHFTQEGAVHEMLSNHDFTVVRAKLVWDDHYVESVLSSMLRIAFSQAILKLHAISLHASVVCHKDKGYLFMGKSGTGKSTHSALWLKNIPNTSLLNDDNPVIRMIEEGIYVYGTPWSGKTPCYRNYSCPVGGMVRLRQAPYNKFLKQNGVQAFIQIIPGCSVIKQDGVLYDYLCDTLTSMIEQVPVGVLECLPDDNAAQCCYHGLLGT